MVLPDVFITTTAVSVDFSKRHCTLNFSAAGVEPEIFFIASFHHFMCSHVIALVYPGGAYKIFTRLGV